MWRGTHIGSRSQLVGQALALWIAVRHHILMGTMGVCYCTFAFHSHFGFRRRASMWQLSSDSDGDDGGIAHNVGNAAAVPRGRGRPAGIFGSRMERELRARVLARHGMEPVAESVARLQSAGRGGMASDHDRIAARLQVLQGSATLGGQLALAASRPASVACDEQATIDEYFGTETRILMGAKAHAAAKGCTLPTAQAHVHDVAACIHYGTIFLLAAA